MKNLMKLLTVLLVIVSVSSFTNFDTTSEGYEIGDVATDFELMNVDGKKVSLSDYKDAKGFILTFTCNTCPFAVAYEDRIIALDKKYASKGYPVIAIMPNNTDVKPGDNMEAMKAVEKSWQMTKGHGWTIFGMAILSFFICIGGLVVFGVGILLSLMWVHAAFATLFQSVANNDDDDNPIPILGVNEV